MTLTLTAIDKRIWRSLPIKPDLYQNREALITQVCFLGSSIVASVTFSIDTLHREHKIHQSDAIY
jgi:hypothetical protein